MSIGPNWAGTIVEAPLCKSEIWVNLKTITFALALEKFNKLIQTLSPYKRFLLDSITSTKRHGIEYDDDIPQQTRAWFT